MNWVECLSVFAAGALPVCFGIYIGRMTGLAWQMPEIRKLRREVDFLRGMLGLAPRAGDPARPRSSPIERLTRHQEN